MLASEQQPAAIEEAPATDAAAPSEPRVKHDIMATKRAVQQADGHFNFWKEEELRAGNAEVKVLRAAVCGPTGLQGMPSLQHMSLPLCIGLLVHSHSMPWPSDALTFCRRDLGCRTISFRSDGGAATQRRRRRMHALTSASSWDTPCMARATRHGMPCQGQQHCRELTHPTQGRFR